MAKENKNDICKACSNKERLRLMLCLSKPQDVTSLLSRCKLSQSALSQHLKVLRDAGIVETEKDGKRVIYRAKDRKALSIAKLLLSYTQ